MRAAVVPVKALGAGKSRLTAGLPRDAVEALTLAMLEDVVIALQGVARVDRIVVATPDARVGEAAAALGAEAVVRDDAGLNAALDAVAAELAGEGLESLLVVLGDVAAAEPGDLGALYDALDGLGGRGVVLAPSRDGGTSALLRAPWDAIPNRFGKDSAAAHRELADARGLPCAVVPRPSLAIDVDRVEDAEALLQAHGAARTRALLARLALEREP